MSRFAAAFVLALIAFEAGGCDLIQAPEPDPINLSLDGVGVVSTETGDLLVQSGEDAFIEAFIKNTSLVDIDSFDIEIQTPSEAVRRSYISGVYINGVQADYGDVALGSGETARVSFHLEVATNTNAGTRIPLAFEVTGAGRRSGRVESELVTDALPYAPAVSRASVISDTNGDGLIQPGESAGIKIEFSDTLHPGTPFCPREVTATPNVPQVVFAGTNPTLGFCYVFGIRASSTISPGTIVPVTVIMKDGLENEWTDIFRFTIN